MAAVTPRAEQWAGFDEPTRARLIEASLDEHDRRIDSIDAKLNKILWALIGACISTSTSTIVLLYTNAR